MTAPNSDDKRLILFENKWLEKLTVVSVGWFVAIWAAVLPVIAYTAWGSLGPVLSIGLVIAGLLSWILLEYVAHRHLFHWETSNSLAQKMVFVIHGNHHTQPGDALRNLMPPIVSLPLGAVLWAAFYLLFGTAGTWFLLGVVSGYVTYDLTHYACHQWPMRSGLGKMLKRHHMRHHFIESEGNFAITAIFLDRVFGTEVTGSSRAGADKPQSARLAQSSK